MAGLPRQCCPRGYALSMFAPAPNRAFTPEPTGQGRRAVLAIAPLYRTTRPVKPIASRRTV